MNTSNTAEEFEGNHSKQTAANTSNELICILPMLLEQGSIVPPGNFGKNILHHTPNKGMDGWMMARELIFEKVRLFMYAQLPSRLNCNFLFTSTAAAIACIQDMTGPMLAPCAYRIELVDSSAPHCIAHFDAFNTIDSNNFYESTQHAAKQYWGNAATNTLPEKAVPEMLTKSPIRIISLVSGGTYHDHLFPIMPSRENVHK